MFQRKPWFLLLTEMLIVLSLLGCFAPSKGHQPPIDITIYYEGRADQPKRVDPAVANDDASHELIFNVYQNLIFFNDKPTLPPATTNVSEWGYSDLSRFEPVLAASMPIASADRQTWTFVIRSGVIWHDWIAANGSIISGQILTAEDVEYTFKRILVQDMLASPSWILNSILTGYEFWDTLDENPFTNTIEPVGVDGAGERLARDLINTAITRINNSVTLHLKEPISESAFLQMMCLPLSCIVNKAFCIENGCWNGTFYDGWSTDYRRKPSNSYSPLDRYYSAKSKYTLANSPVTLYGGAMCGTGPYKFTYWNKTAGEWRIDSFTDYWGGWMGSHVNASVVKYVPEWPMRKLLLLSGELDSITEPEENIPPFGVVQYYHAPMLSTEFVAYVFHVAEDSPYIPKVGGFPQPYFFNNTHIRKAFAYACGCVPCEGIRPASWWAKGLAPDYENKSLTPYMCNLDAMRAELEAAGVWDLGFETYLVYVLGNEQVRMKFEFIAECFRMLGSQFKCYVIGLDYPIYQDYKETFFLPVFADRVSASYCDPDNFARSTMYHLGYIAYYQRYNDSYVNKLIGDAYHMGDGQQRNVTYQGLQFIYWRDAISSPIEQSVASFWFRDWVRGYYYNPVYPGLYFYDLYKTVLVPPSQVDVSVEIMNVTQWLIYDHGKADVEINYPYGTSQTPPIPIWLSVSRVDGNPVDVPVVVAVLWINSTGFIKVIDIVSDVLEPYSVKDYTFVLNDPYLKLDNYTILGEAYISSSTVYDQNLTNNQANGGAFEAVFLLGDINCDRYVEMMDFYEASIAFGTYPGHPRWNIRCDLYGENGSATSPEYVGDGVIEMMDFYVLSITFGHHLDP